jgi:hypothetical protein
MAKLTIRKRLEKLSEELASMGVYIRDHESDLQEDASQIDNLATGISQQGAALAAVARKVQGHRGTERLVKQVRKALGFSYP